METPPVETSRRRAGAAGSVPVPLAEVLRIAGEYERAGQLEAARRMLGHVLMAMPDQPDALHLAGVVAFRLGRPADALALMERALAHGIDTPLYLRNICEV